jgi:gamma-glutamyltranspeptidase
MSNNGMVASGHPLASEAGINILRNGGNVIDAALAVASTLSVVEPMMSGIGGDGYMMVYWKETDSIHVINGTGAAPLNCTPDQFKKDGIPSKGIMSVSTPGLLNAWFDAHEKFGTLSLTQIFNDAISLATNGFPVTHYLSNAIGEDPFLCNFPDSQEIFTHKGIPLQPGEKLIQKNLGTSLKTIATEGRETFYKGKIAEQLIQFVTQHDGILSLEDLTRCHSRWENPISTNYKGHTVYETPPNSSGHVLLQELNILESFDITKFSRDSSELIHIMIEAKKLAFDDREHFLCDPDFKDIPIEGLLSKAYANLRATQIDTNKANKVIVPGNPWDYQEQPPQSNTSLKKGVKEESENTTCFVLMDKDGNAVCQLQSLQSAWGSGMIAGETGILLNNRMTYWNLEPDHINYLIPGQRTRHTMNAVMVFDESSNKKCLEWVLGTPGADTQVQSNFQVLVNLIDFDLNITEAVEYPRWKDILSPTESNYPHTFTNEVMIEDRFAPEILTDLENKGHKIRKLNAWDGLVGREMIIKANSSTNTLEGAADPRYDGYVSCW